MHPDVGIGMTEQPLAMRYLHPAQDDMIPLAKGVHVIPVAKPYIRITSYNVCYTKLLRTVMTVVALEESRATDVIEALRRGKEEALSLARRYQSEERWRAEKNLRRLTMVLVV